MYSVEIQKLHYQNRIDRLSKKGMLNENLIRKAARNLRKLNWSKPLENQLCRANKNSGGHRIMYDEFEFDMEILLSIV